MATAYILFIVHFRPTSAPDWMKQRPNGVRSKGWALDIESVKCIVFYGMSEAAININWTAKERFCLISSWEKWEKEQMSRLDHRRLSLLSNGNYLRRPSTTSHHIHTAQTNHSQNTRWFAFGCETAILINFRYHLTSRHLTNVVVARRHSNLLSFRHWHLADAVIRFERANALQCACACDCVDKCRRIEFVCGLFETKSF